MNWQEDFEDVPSPEERMPFGLEPIEMTELFIEASFGKCECCSQQFPEEQLIRTGMNEYVQMDIDPDSAYCSECYDACRERHIPSNPMMFDAYTPVAVC